MAPVVLFVYNRPDHTSLTLEALKNNVGASEIVLYIFYDGLKNNASESQKANHSKVREIIHAQNWCKEVIIKEAETNLGLASSIISGVTQVVNKHGNVIVLEDDIVTSPMFLGFMNTCLERYENQKEVISISGYMYPSQDLGHPFFIYGADCWGWATWKRGWDLFEANGSVLLEKLIVQKRSFEFDLDGNYGYTQMLKDQISGKVNSWAIRWHASAFLSNKLTLYPNKSFVQNIGIDGSGTHCGPSDQWQVNLNQELPDLETVVVVEDQEGRELLKTFYKEVANATKPLSIYARIKRKLKHLLKSA